MEEYRGRHVGCAPGTHEALVRLVLKHLQPQQDVLDLGAHSGALLARLEDAGFSDLCGVDLDATRFDLPGADFMTLELNGPFSDAVERKFSLITATDVIEHLDSPRSFLIEVRKLLKPDGVLALSFPNVAFWEGRLKFLLTGELWGFGARNYRLQRHISPLTFEQTDLMMQELGFKVLELTTAGSFASNLRVVALAPLWMPMKLIGGARTQGESTIVVARRAEEDSELKMPLHYRERWSGNPDRIGLDT